jgi:hypothetical protein
MSRLIIVISVMAATCAGCVSTGLSSSDHSGVTVAPVTTPTPTLLDTPPSNCPHMPLGGFSDVWHNEQVYPRLGCAVAPAEAVTGTETYLCGGTHTLWLREKRLFAVIPVWPHLWRFIADESNLPEDMPLMEEPAPRPKPCFPVSGRHGWLAHFLNPDGANEPLGQTSEMAFSGAIQQFEGGWLLWNGNVCFVLFEDGTWTMF